MVILVCFGSIRLVRISIGAKSYSLYGVGVNALERLEIRHKVARHQDSWEFLRRCYMFLASLCLPRHLRNRQGKCVTLVKDFEFPISLLAGSLNSTGPRMLEQYKPAQRIVKSLVRGKIASAKSPSRPRWSVVKPGSRPVFFHPRIQQRLAVFANPRKYKRISENSRGFAGYPVWFRLVQVRKRKTHRRNHLPMRSS